MTIDKSKVAASMLALSAAGLMWIARNESGGKPQLQAYKDPVGIPTICYGHTKAVRLGQKKTLDQCETLLREDTGSAGQAVASLVKVDLSQGQYDALVSFVYNVGPGSFQRSALLKKLNAGDCRGAGAEFLKWDHAGGRALPGLTRRRQEESRLFLLDCTKG